MPDNCVVSWENLVVGKWYRIGSQGIGRPVKFAGASIWEEEQEEGWTTIKGKPITPRPAGWYPLECKWIDKTRGTYIGMNLYMQWSLLFTDAAGLVMASFLLHQNSDLMFFEPVMEPRRRYNSNAERQQAYRERMKEDHRAYIKVDDRIILPIDGVPTKFEVVYVPHTADDLRRGRGQDVRLSNILLQRV